MSDLPTAVPAGDSLPPAAAPEAPTEGNLEKIRELLFGREMNAMDKRFSRLESRLEAEAAALRADIAARMQALEMHVKNEFTALRAAVEQERRERIAAVDRLAAEAAGEREGLAREIREARDAGQRSEQALRQLVADESADAENALRSTTDEIRRTMARHAAALEDRKADRTALAAIFAEAASRLNEAA